MASRWSDDAVFRFAAAAIAEGQTTREAAHALLTSMGEAEAEPVLSGLIEDGIRLASALERSFPKGAAFDPDRPRHLDPAEKDALDVVLQAYGVAGFRRRHYQLDPDERSLLEAPLGEAFHRLSLLEPRLVSIGQEVRRTGPLRWSAADTVVEQAEVARDLSLDAPTATV
jgi:hypothetical protein